MLSKLKKASLLNKLKLKTMLAMILAAALNPGTPWRN